jgi:hypothetical protein
VLRQDLTGRTRSSPALRQAPLDLQPWRPVFCPTMQFRQIDAVPSATLRRQSAQLICHLRCRPVAGQIDPNRSLGLPRGRRRSPLAYQSANA